MSQPINNKPILKFIPGQNYSLYYQWEDKSTKKNVQAYVTAQFTGKVFDIKDRVSGKMTEAGEFIHLNNKKHVPLTYERLVELQPSNLRQFDANHEDEEMRVWEPQPIS